LSAAGLVCRNLFHWPRRYCHKRVWRDTESAGFILFIIELPPGVRFKKIDSDCMKDLNTPILLSGPGDVSLPWAQRIVSRYAGQAKVKAVNLASVDVGTSTRLRIEVDHDAPELLPQRWFVKTPSLAWKSRAITALPRFLHKEVRFYQRLSRHIPLKMPRILAAESRFGRGSILVMSDLAEHDFRPGRAADALSVEQARLVVGHLAKLHGRYWNRPAVLHQHRWLNGFSQQVEHSMGALLAVPLMKRGLARAGGHVVTGLHKPAIRYAANRRGYKRLLANEPMTLVHYDCHPGNIFWTDREPGFLDWQLVRWGEGVGDIAYFLATGLQPELRRAHERSLLQHYAAELERAGVAAVNDNALFRRYQAHLVYPFEAMTVTLAIGGMMQAEANLELVRRTAIAAADHDSFAILEP